jgi:proline iminopeptidase
MVDAGVRMVTISTPKGDRRVWTKKVGDNPTIQVLLLHGGPGATHEYFECFDDYLPSAGIAFYYYDQLGSGQSEPIDPELVELDRFVDEVEQVRRALGLGPDNFFLLGHSWGGLLATEYALTHRGALKGLVISNMMSSCPAYNAYANDVLMPTIDPDVLAEIKRFEAVGDTGNPRYMALLLEHHYVDHVLRMPVDQWPDAVNRAFDNINPDVYVPMQGPSELGLSGKLLNWDRSGDLAQIDVPTLVIGARHDTMDPAHMAAMAERLPKGRLLLCENGSHMAMWDDQETYFAGLIDFLTSV